MIRRVINIDEEKCNGCGICVNACHEGAIGLVDGKAKLLRDDYCFRFLAHIFLNCCFIICSRFSFNESNREEKVETNVKLTSKLAQWPVQIKLVPINAPYFDGANLLIAADCTAYAYANFHQEFMNGKITIVGCPKLDAVDYSEKLTEIIRNNDIKSVTIVRMEVPCCGGLENAAKTALQNSGKFIPWNVVTISIDGQILLSP